MARLDYDLQEMLSLYATGDWTHKMLGEKYGKDRTTIMHHTKKFGVVPDPNGAQRRAIARMRVKHPVDPRFHNRHELAAMQGKPAKPAKPEKKAPVVDKYAHLYDPPVNKGKTYAEYVAEALKRPIEGHYHRLCTEVPVRLDNGRVEPRSGATLSV